MRMHMRRFTRLTNAFSKKVENHAAAIALHTMYYNFVRIRQTLKVTPAMAAAGVVLMRKDETDRRQWPQPRRLSTGRSHRKYRLALYCSTAQAAHSFGFLNQKSDFPCCIKVTEIFAE